jgi:hypothetical protein
MTITASCSLFNFVIKNTGKKGCNVTCIRNNRLMGSILQIGLKKDTFIVGNSESQKIAQIQRISKPKLLLGKKFEGLDQAESYLFLVCFFYVSNFMDS